MATMQLPSQVLADACERDVADRYDRRREFSSVVADAVRRAAALRRLEFQLQTRTRGS